jgi:membrane protein implicated in regulation of membrane protease activity
MPNADRFLYSSARKGNALASYWIWWIVAAALVAAELLTLTFYLVVIGSPRQAIH